MFSGSSKTHDSTSCLFQYTYDACTVQSTSILHLVDLCIEYTSGQDAEKGLCKISTKDFPSPLALLTSQLLLYREGLTIAAINRVSCHNAFRSVSVYFVRSIRSYPQRNIYVFVILVGTV